MVDKSLSILAWVGRVASSCKWREPWVMEGCVPGSKSCGVRREALMLLEEQVLSKSLVVGRPNAAAVGLVEASGGLLVDWCH